MIEFLTGDPAAPDSQSETPKVSISDVVEAALEAYKIRQALEKCSTEIGPKEDFRLVVLLGNDQNTAFVGNPLEHTIALNWNATNWLTGAGPSIVYAIDAASSAPTSSANTKSREPSISQLIQEIRSDTSCQYAERLANRIGHLERLSADEYPDQEPISRRSLADFASYFRLHRRFRYPNVILTYSGNIRASWRNSEEEYFALEFFGSMDVGFVVFSPDPYYPAKTTRVSGSTSLDRIDSILASYQVFVWVTQPDG